MKTVTILKIWGACGFALISLTAFAGSSQDNPPATNSPPVTTVPGTNVPSLSPSPDRADSGHGNHGHPSVPSDHGRVLQPPGNGHSHGTPSWSGDVQSLVKQFQGDQTSFAAQRQQLLAQMKQAGAADRAKVRDQLRALRNQWLAEREQLREQIRDRLQEIRTELRNQRDQQLNDVSGGGDGHHQKH